MNIRILTHEEHLEANLISTIAFHSRIPDLEERKAQWNAEKGKYKSDDWGAFSDYGELMAHVINTEGESYLYGTPVKTSCIGAVSTLPEYRSTGAVRAMFKEILPHARKCGQIISALYPFNHAFYRKFGYETACFANRYEFPVSLLENYRHAGWVKMWNPGEATDYFTQVYSEFSKNYNLAFLRDDKLMADTVRGVYYKDRRFCYLIGDTENGPTAYVVFDDISENGGHIIDVADSAWTSPHGLRSLLGFLARFTADYEKIRISLPTNLNLHSLVSAPYDIKTETQCGYMVRILDIPKALALMPRPESPFTLSVTDDIIPENTGTYIITSEGVTRTDSAPNIELTIQTLSQLVTGAASLAEALYNPSVKLNSNSETLHKAFPGHPIFVSDHF